MSEGRGEIYMTLFQPHHNVSQSPPFMDLVYLGEVTHQAGGKLIYAQFPLSILKIFL